MKTISITAYNRPEYLQQTLRGLTACIPSEWHLFASVDPSDKTPQIEECIAAAQGFASKNITINKERKNHRRNQHDAIAMAFAAGSTFNLHLDDDLFISPDALRLAYFYKKTFSAAPLTCGSYGLFNYGSDASCSRDIVIRKGTFTGLGWCSFKENWEMYFSPHWFDDTYAQRTWGIATTGWDWNVHGFFRQHGIYECFPALSRTNHAGRENGTCCDKNFYDKTFVCTPMSDQNINDFIVRLPNE